MLDFYQDYQERPMEEVKSAMEYVVCWLDAHGQLDEACATFGKGEDDALEWAMGIRRAETRGVLIPLYNWIGKNNPELLALCYDLAEAEVAIALKKKQAPGNIDWSVFDTKDDEWFSK